MKLNKLKEIVYLIKNGINWNLFEYFGIFRKIVILLKVKNIMIY
jgi:hypothetical protein